MLSKTFHLIFIYHKVVKISVKLLSFHSLQQICQLQYLIIIFIFSSLFVRISNSNYNDLIENIYMYGTVHL